MTRVRMILIALLVVGGAIVLWWRSTHNQGGPLDFSGVVEATTYDIGFEMPGTIARIAVREGDAVKVGQLLAELDPRSQQAARDQAAARLKAAQARLLELEHGARPQELASARERVEMARAQLRQLENGATAAELQAAAAAAASARERYQNVERGSRSEDVASAHSQLEAARTELNVQQRDYARYQQLYREGAAPEQLLDVHRNQYSQAQAAYESAVKTYQKLQAGPRREERQAAYQEYQAQQARYQDLARGTRPELIEQARAALGERQQQLALLESGTRSEQLEQARQQVSEARAVLAAAETALSKTRLLSPVQAVVRSQLLEEGEAVMSGQSVISLTDLEHPWVDIFIPETELARVPLGAGARISVDSLPGQTLEGSVTRVYEQAEYTPKFIQTTRERVKLVFRAKVSFANPELKFRPGMPADVKVLP